jgi:hypothetical protein
MNPVNYRLGRREFAKRAHRKTVLERCEQIHREIQTERLRQQLIKSLAQELDIDDCVEVYK